MICQNTVSEKQSARYPWNNTSGPTQRRRGPENISSEKPNAHPWSSLQPYHQLPHPSYQSIALEKKCGSRYEGQGSRGHETKFEKKEGRQLGGRWLVERVVVKEPREALTEMHARVEGGRSTPMIAGCIGTPSDSAWPVWFARARSAAHTSPSRSPALSFFGASNFLAGRRACTRPRPP